MKKALKYAAATLILLMLCCTGVQAAGKPGNVSSLKVSGTTGTTVTLKWSKASGASGYLVYRVNGKKASRIAKTKARLIQ